MFIRTILHYYILMIYLVSKNTSLFSPVKYETINFDRAIDILNLLKEVQIDTETEGLIFRF